MPIPSNLQSRLWSQSTSSLDINQNKKYIIEQILHYGTMEDLHWLLDTYPLKIIKEVYLESKPNFHPSVSHFINLFLEAQRG